MVSYVWVVVFRGVYGYCCFSNSSMRWLMWRILKSSVHIHFFSEYIDLPSRCNPGELMDLYMTLVTGAWKGV